MNQSVRAFCVMLIGLTFLAGCGAGNPSKSVNKRAPANTGFQLVETQIDGKRVKYSVFLPFDYNPQIKRPAIVFLHGLFEGGTDGKKSTTVGLGPEINRRKGNFPYIVVFPQTAGSWKSQSESARSLAILIDAQSRFAIDPNRVAITGLSTGGYGTWALAARDPSRFRALIPICAYDHTSAIDAIKHIPVWAFHNRLDPFVGAGDSSKMVNRIKLAGGDAQVTLYGAVGHDAWTRAYRDDKLWQWLDAKMK